MALPFLAGKSHTKTQSHKAFLLVSSWLCVRIYSLRIECIVNENGEFVNRGRLADDEQTFDSQTRA